MCGFLAEVSLGEDRRRIEDRFFNSSALTLTHRRGPDETAFHYGDDQNIFFARLGLVDYQHGSQPFYTSNGFLVFGNGEIYNSEDLLESLALDRAAISSVGNHDIKIAAEILSQDPRNNWDLLNGMYSIVLISPSGAIYLGRDRTGEKPLFFARNDDHLVMGSNFEAVALQSRTPCTLDSEQLDNWLIFGGFEPGKTLVKEISEVRPGTVVEVRRDSFKEYQYWRWPSRAETISFDLDEFKRIALESIDLVRSNGNEGCVLWSGGIDSSVVKKYVFRSNESKQNIHISFNDKTFDEPVLSESEEMPPTSTLYLDFDSWLSEENLELAIELMDLPISDPSCIPLLAACQLAKENGFKVVYTGDGADEALLGYEALRHENVLNFLTLLIRLIPRRLVLPVFLFFSQIPDYRYISLRSILLRILATRFAQFGERKGLLVSPNYFLSHVVTKSQNRIPGYFTNLEPYFQQFVLPQIYLQKSDRMSAGLGLESRSPWLTQSFIEFSMNIPKIKLRKHGKPLWSLMDKSSERRRKKHGLGVPLHKVLQLLPNPEWIIPNLSKETIEKIWVGSDKKSAGIQNAAWSLYILNKKLHKWSNLGIIGVQ